MTNIKFQEIVDVFEVEEHSYVENEKKDIRDIKKSFRIEQDAIGVFVVAVARHISDEMNYLMDIPVDAGKPLTYEAYDIVKDCYHIIGVASYDLGLIPVNYVVAFDEVPWRENIPLPPNVIRRYMSEHQKKMFDAWKVVYKSPQYSISYVQMLNVH